MRVFTYRLSSNTNFRKSLQLEKFRKTSQRIWLGQFEWNRLFSRFFLTKPRKVRSVIAPKCKPSWGKKSSVMLGQVYLPTLWMNVKNISGTERPLFLSFISSSGLFNKLLSTLSLKFWQNRMPATVDLGFLFGQNYVELQNRQWILINNLCQNFYN